MFRVLIAFLRQRPNGSNAITSTRCDLLELPAELRNIIYTIALSNLNINRGIDIDVDLDENNFKEPAIIRTCRQTRQEASTFFYNYPGRIFMLFTPELNFGPQIKHWIWTKVDYQQRHIKFLLYDLTWDRVQPWFRLCHSGAIDVDEFGSENNWDDVDVKRAFEMIMLMRDLTWAKVERVLELFKQCVEEASNVEAFERTWD